MLKKALKSGAAATALLIAFGGAASATVYDYTGAANPAGGPALSCEALGIFNTSCSVTYNTAGLGVNGRFDTQPGEIDGFPVASSERLTLTFASAVRWNSITMGLWDSNDDMRLTADGLTFQYGPNVGNTVALGGYISNFLTITAYGVPFSDDGWGNDSFTLASIDVSAVPLPAALPLLAAGLGGLGFMGRRKKKAA